MALARQHFIGGRWTPGSRIVIGKIDLPPRPILQDRLDHTPFRRNGVLCLNLISSPGAGKTSLLERTLESFAPGERVAVLTGDIQTDKTDSALVEFVREIKGIRGDRPVTDDELAAGKAKLIQSLPSRLASINGVSGLVNEIYVNGLPEDYWTRFMQAVNAVTAADVQRVARQYVDIDHLTILIVGDRAKIEGPVRATGVAAIVVLDKNGNPMK